MNETRARELLSQIPGAVVAEGGPIITVEVLGYGGGPSNEEEDQPAE